MSHAAAPIQDAPAPDATATGKPHYEVLDGLRGTAAVLVVLFHIMGMTANWSDNGQLVHHGHLAVDFFFTLSGFVIGYAYNDRWGRMGLKQFFLTRLVRLHPLVLLGAVLGVLSFVFDPFAGATQSVIPLRTVAIDFVLIAFLLPHPPLPNRWTDTHSLNSPAWSLLQEYIGNIAYALILRRLKARWLFAILIVTGAGLIWCAAQNNSMDMGSDFGSYWRGTLRMAFSFTLGLWLYRVHDRFPEAASRLDRPQPGSDRSHVRAAHPAERGARQWSAGSGDGDPAVSADRAFRRAFSDRTRRDGGVQVCGPYFLPDLHSALPVPVHLYELRQFPPSADAGPAVMGQRRLYRGGRFCLVGAETL